MGANWIVWWWKHALWQCDWFRDQDARLHVFQGVSWSPRGGGGGGWGVGGGVLIRTPNPHLRNSGCLLVSFFYIESLHLSWYCSTAYLYKHSPRRCIFSSLNWVCRSQTKPAGKIKTLRRFAFKCPPCAAHQRWVFLVGRFSLSNNHKLRWSHSCILRLTRHLSWHKISKIKKIRDSCFSTVFRYYAICYNC